MRNALALLALLPALYGCFPVVATGIGTGVLMAEDRRTPGTFIDDEGIELKVNKRISEKLKDKVHTNVTSYNRAVLITGEAPNEALKREIEQIARGVENIARLSNEVSVAAPSSMGSRANDAYLTSAVKARFLDANKFKPNLVKVVTENSTVYLLGLVSRKEAEDAADIARSTSGVQKVVKVFEYVD